VLRLFQCVSQVCLFYHFCVWYRECLLINQYQIISCGRTWYEQRITLSRLFMDDEKLVYKHMSNDERYICPTWSLKDEYKQYINSTRANYGTCLGTRVKNQVISHIEWQIMDDERMRLRLKQTEQNQSHGKRSRYVDSTSYEVTT